MNTRALRIAVTIFCLSFLLASQHADGAIVFEVEPNNFVEMATDVQCGDTVRCAGLDGEDIDYFRVLMYAGDSLIVYTDTCDNSDVNTMLLLYDSDFTLLDIDYNGGYQNFSRIDYWIKTPGWYAVRVDRPNYDPDSDTTYNLIVDCFTPPPDDYDHCESARVVTGLPYYDEGSTAGNTNDAGTDAPDVFYSFHQPVLSDLKIEVCSEFFDARVQMLGSCIGDYMDDADAGDCLNGATLYSYEITPGDYYFLVEGTSLLEAGSFSIEIEPFYPECPEPEQLIVTDIGGLPSLDWVDVAEAEYYLIKQSTSYTGPYQNLDTTYISFYQDPVGFAADVRFYQVISVCPWSR